jgi:ABC-type enterochelin transport system substrate-binding protein
MAIPDFDVEQEQQFDNSFEFMRTCAQQENKRLVIVNNDGKLEIELEEKT